MANYPGYLITLPDGKELKIEMLHGKPTLFRYLDTVCAEPFSGYVRSWADEDNPPGDWIKTWTRTNKHILITRTS